MNFDRPSWVPGTVSDSDLSEFLKTINEAVESGQSGVTFGGVRYAITEGITARARARLAGTVGAVKGLGKIAHGSATSVKGAITGNASNLDKGARLIARGSIEGRLAKLTSIEKSALKRLDEVVHDVVNDLKALNVKWENDEEAQAPAEMAAEAYKTFRGYMQDLFTELAADTKDSILRTRMKITPDHGQQVPAKDPVT